jgi:hypothetical protein
MFCVQHVQAGLQVNFEFGQEYASEKNGIVVLIKLNVLAILCVRSGEFMIFPTDTLFADCLNYQKWRTVTRFWSHFMEVCEVVSNVSR